MFSRIGFCVLFLYCEVWNFGEFLWFMIFLNYFKWVVFFDFGFLVVVFFSYYNGVFCENWREVLNLLRSFYSCFIYFFLNYNLVYVMCIGFYSGFIYLFWIVLNLVLYIINISIIMIFFIIYCYINVEGY